MKIPNNRSICFVPLDLLMEIFFHLPLNSILRFRSVSKSWKTIIEDPNFSVYIKRRPNNIQNPYLIFSEKRQRLGTRWVLRCSKTARRALDIEFPVDMSRAWKICGGLDGLILLLGNEWHHAKNIIVLWNPSIRKTIYLPPNPFKLPDFYHREGRLLVDGCLLFDASNNDYKVVIIYCHRYNLYSISAPLVDVFSLKSHSWRRVVDDNKAPARVMFYCGPSACIGESAHWIGINDSYNMRMKKRTKVISFNLTSNMFSCTPFPKDTDNLRELYCQVIVLSGSILGFLAFSRRKHVTIWAMEGSSSTTTCLTQQCCWTRRYQFNGTLVLPEYFCVSIQKRDVLLWGSKSLRSYDMETDRSKVILPNYLCEAKYIGLYVESLLLMEYGANSELVPPKSVR